MTALERQKLETLLADLNYQVAFTWKWYCDLVEELNQVENRLAQDPLF